VFNLIVSGRVGHDQKGFIPVGRVFEHTSEQIKAQFMANEEIDINAAMTLPTLLMEEGWGNEVARIAQLSGIQRSGIDYQLTYSIDHKMPKLTNADIMGLLIELEINKYELTRNHWAIKNADLFRVLLNRNMDSRPSPSVFQLSDNPVDPTKVSFMMPFSSKFDDVYQAVEIGLVGESFTCHRADNMWINHHIIQDILELICTSQVIICDLSEKNPNVFYEAGIAHTLGKEVILITQSHDDVPFDLRSLRYIHYLNNEEGRKKLNVEILERLKSITKQ